MQAHARTHLHSAHTTRARAYTHMGTHICAYTHKHSHTRTHTYMHTYTRIVCSVGSTGTGGRSRDARGERAAYGYAYRRRAGFKGIKSVWPLVPHCFKPANGGASISCLFYVQSQAFTLLKKSYAGSGKPLPAMNNEPLWCRVP